MESNEAAAVAASVGLIGIAVFQAALALGAPFGKASWGGSHEGKLPSRLRIASAFACVVWVFAAVVVLERAGFEILGLPSTFVRWGTWALVVILSLGALMNFISRSRWERYLWGPVALITAVLCLIVALGPEPVA